MLAKPRLLGIVLLEIPPRGAVGAKRAQCSVFGVLVSCQLAPLAGFVFRARAANTGHYLLRDDQHYRSAIGLSLLRT